MAPNKLSKQTLLQARLMTLLALIVGVALPSITAQQNLTRGDIPDLVFNAMSPLCKKPGDASVSGPSSLTCLMLLSGVAVDNTTYDAWGNVRGVLLGCCADMNAHSKPGFSEECGCGYLEFLQAHGIVVKPEDCDLTELRERCREVQLSKLDPCERLIQRLNAGETSKINWDDVPACEQELSACRSACHA